MTDKLNQPSDNASETEDKFMKAPDNRNEISEFLDNENFSREKPVIAVSACVLGKLVRYNKNHTHDKWLTGTLGKFVDFCHFCPEVEMGLGVPRDEIYISYKEDGELLLRKRKSGDDITALAMTTYESINERLRERSVNGYVLMKKSPSCGFDRVKAVSDNEKGPVKHLTGLFGTNMLENFPEIPVIDSGRLSNSILREHFVKNIFAHFRLSKVEKTSKALQEFHKRYKYVLMEHSQDNLRKLGAIAANHENLTGDEIYRQYSCLFLETIKMPASIGKRFNTLQHVMGYFKKELSKEDKAHLTGVLDDYRKGILQYNVPLNLFSFFVDKYNVTYLKNHYYFEPYPKELNLLREL
jgi:uncharacterized protein YbgA (DUF1722 family)/uncharacterized protein YbbK (DUF523 family)